MKVTLNSFNELCEKIKNNGEYLICTPKEYKEAFLEKINENPFSYQVKFITLEQLIEKLTFSYDENAIYYLMDKYKYNYDIACSYLKNLFLSTFINEDNPKVNTLKTIYQELLNNNVLIIDHIFKETIKDKKIIIVGYNDLKKEYLQVLDKYQYDFYTFAKNINCLKDVRCCENIEKELHFILDEISGLVNQGVELNKIKIIGLTNNDTDIVKRMFGFYNIPVNLNDEKLIINYPFFNCNELEYIDVNSLNEKELAIYKEAIDCINKINLKTSNNSSVKKEIILRKLKELKIPSGRFKSAVDVLSFDSYLDSYIYQDCYLFVCRLNESILPTIVKDEEYFKDSIKEKYKINTSYQENYHNKQALKELICSCQNIQISYSIYGDSKLYPSSIITDLNLNVIKYKGKYNHYSNKYNKILLIRYLDLLSKYGDRSIGLNELYSTYSMNDYMNYDNKFKVSNHKEFLDNLRKKYSEGIKLSYTSLNEYHSCPFAYYYNNILNLKNFESTFSLFIGNLYHDVLKNVFKDNKTDEQDIDKYIQEYIENVKVKELEKETKEKILKEKFPKEKFLKEKFLLEKLIEELKEIIKVIKDKEQWISYKNTLFEENINIKSQINVDGFNTKKIFTGQIDKLYYKEIKDENGNLLTYVSLIDYKTGKAEINLNLMDYGLSMQLPIYIYMIKDSNLFSNVLVSGIFIQSILNNHKTEKGNIEEMEKEYQNEREKSLLYEGYLCDDNNGFDITENNSLLIKSLKRNNDGKFSKNSKVLSRFQIDELYNKTKEKIDQTFEDILKGRFPIEPKYLKNTIDSCEYCKCKDLCYKTYKDTIFITLGGDKNA